MKKIIAAILLAVLAVSLVSCGADPAKKSKGAMTYAEYMAAELESDVIIEAYVQATQSWWDGKITVYAADPDGAYFIYELKCSETDAAKLTKGTKIRVTGRKTEWSGEVEIADASFTFGDDVTYVSKAADLTSKLGTDDLIKHQNELAVFKGMTVKALEYQGGTRGKDIYLTVTKDGKDYSFCVESYLTSPDSDVYKAVEALVAGDVVDIEAFLYWYNGANPHIVGVSKK